MSTTLTVANTIRTQLGGACLTLLGAKDLVGGPDHLQFRIQGCRKVNVVVITLKDDDTYTMEFWYIRGVKFTKVSSHEGVYFDQMHATIEQATGLCARF